ncbi:hypothetical protein A5882_002464 [Enterococcus sp. 4E1_DIV0656]|nr:hypothetical protein A5882_002464 [Enterococcus sp. 4E1_DIV0656]
MSLIGKEIGSFEAKAYHNAIAVSYTHLDVYKRQFLRMITFFLTISE